MGPNQTDRKRILNWERKQVESDSDSDSDSRLTHGLARFESLDDVLTRLSISLHIPSPFPVSPKSPFPSSVIYMQAMKSVSLSGLSFFLALNSNPSPSLSFPPSRRLLSVGIRRRPCAPCKVGRRPLLLSRRTSLRVLPPSSICRLLLAESGINFDFCWISFFWLMHTFCWWHPEVFTFLGVSTVCFVRFRFGLTLTWD